MLKNCQPARAAFFLADQLAIAWEFRDELVVILRRLVRFVLFAVKPTGMKQFQVTHG